MRIHKTAYIILCFLLLNSCKKDEYETVNRSYGKGYSSTRPGSYNIYKVEEIIYDDFFNTIDTFRYQLKESNQSFFTDNLGRKALRIERYKMNTNNQWDLLNVWYSVEDNVSYERVEENIRYVKLSFPLNEEVVWNLNAYNSENSNYVYYNLINQKYSLDSFKFDSAISVKSDPVSSSLRQREYNEVYARNIGLVYQNIVHIDKNGTQLRGYRYKQKLLKHVP